MSSEHLDPHDARGLRLSTAMNRPLYAPLRDVPLPITMEDEPTVTTSQSAMSLLARLGLVALLIFAFLAAWAAAVYFPAWPWLVAWLGAL